MTAPEASVTVPVMRAASVCENTRGRVMAPRSVKRRTLVSIPLQGSGIRLQPDKQKMKKSAWFSHRLRGSLDRGNQFQLHLLGCLRPDLHLDGLALHGLQEIGVVPGFVFDLFPGEGEIVAGRNVLQGEVPRFVARSTAHRFREA